MKIEKLKKEKIFFPKAQSCVLIDKINNSFIYQHLFLE